MSHNAEGVEGQDNIYGSLTNSLIFPNAMHFPRMSQQGWQGPMGWQQDDGTVDNGYPNFYQGHMMGAAPNYLYNEQDIQPYDEGEEDFYETQQQQWDPHGETEAHKNQHNSNVKEPSSRAWLLLSLTLIPCRVYKELTRKQALQQQFMASQSLLSRKTSQILLRRIASRETRPATLVRPLLHRIELLN